MEAHNSWPSRKENLRSGVRSAMIAARQSPGRGPIDVDDATTPARSSKIRL